MSADISIEEIIKLPGLEDVLAELEDPRFGGRTHGSRATAAKKCRGPLCRKAERDNQRIRNERKAFLAGRAYKEDENRLWDRDELLDAIILWHRKTVAMARIDAITVGRKSIY